MKEKTKFIESLSKLISFKSVQGESTPDCPFGQEVKNALVYFLDLAKSMGFNTINYDNYIGEVYFGEGEEIGIIGHLDVVPEGSGWKTDPFTLTIINDNYYGRGMLDDKAPILICLYALKELKEETKFNRKIRLFVGCNEESGWKDIEYFKSVGKFPEYGFSPDGDFPVSYAEKGPNSVTFKFPYCGNFKNFKGGTVVNAVCSYASVEGEINENLLNKFGLTNKGNLIESVGVASHGAYPELGKNAILPILQYMSALNENVTDIIELLFNDKFNITKIGNETGFATLSPNLISQTDDYLIITADFRVPAKMNLIDFLPYFDKMKVKYTCKKNRDPLYVPKNSEFVTKLMSAYNEVMHTDLEPLSQRGATFASVFKQGVAFGPELPNEKSTIHEPNEFTTDKNIELMHKIYKKAIFELIK